MDAHHKAAFQVLADKDGKVSEAAVVEALLHGHEKNSEFLDAMGLQVQQVMKAAEPMTIFMTGSLEACEQALKEMSQASTDMASMRFDEPMPVMTGAEEDPGECQVQ